MSHVTKSIYDTAYTSYKTIIYVPIPSHCMTYAGPHIFTDDRRRRLAPTPLRRRLWADNEIAISRVGCFRLNLKKKTIRHDEQLFTCASELTGSRSKLKIYKKKLKQNN